MPKKKKRSTEQTCHFLDVVSELRKKCPWDRKQTHASLARYLLEEAYETVDAINSKNKDSLKEELGDVLLQVALHSEIASEKKHFTFEDVAQGVADKMIRRHPHVFAAEKYTDYQTHLKNWTRLKSEEKPKRKMLDGIPKSLPALQLAQRYGEIASSVGFDWNSPNEVWKKIDEEMGEFRTALKGKKADAEMELGDVLFCLVQLARHLDLDAERALKSADEKFRKRFTELEKRKSKKGKKLADYSMKELDKEWEQVKRLGL